MISGKKQNKSKRKPHKKHDEASSDFKKLLATLKKNKTVNAGEGSGTQGTD